MIKFPNCKINLGLNVVNKREDGFHNLETVFYPIPLKDAIEVISVPSFNDISKPEYEFTSTGLSVNGNTADNLCLKAFYLLKKDFPQIPFLKIHLHKQVPIGAGLGGGSADAAFMLRLINEKLDLGISDEQLIGYASELGSDCPFFILNKPCFASGRGELMLPIELDLSAYTFVLVNPGIHINTSWAFGLIKPKTPVKSIHHIIFQNIATWKKELFNDFEKPVAAAYPVVSNIKFFLYELGAVYASMSGSGSSVFGIFNSRPSLPEFPAGYKVFVI